MNLGPILFAILAELVAAAGDVVSYELLVEMCWPEADEQDGRHRLSVAICRLRSALGSPRIIECVYRSGYRLDT